MGVIREIYLNLTPSCRFLKFNKQRQLWEEVRLPAGIKLNFLRCAFAVSVCPFLAGHAYFNDNGILLQWLKEKNHSLLTNRCCNQFHSGLLLYPTCRLAPKLLKTR